MFKDNAVFGGDNHYNPAADNHYNPAADNHYNPAADNHYNPAADNHYNPAAGKIRNLKVQTKVTYLTTNIKPIFHPISGRISL